MPGTFNRVSYVCRHCGRRWAADTKALGTNNGWTGFLSATVMRHESLCVKRTPAQRRQWATQDAKRRERSPNRHTEVQDNFNHPGMRDT